MLVEYTEPRLHTLMGSRKEGSGQIQFTFRPGAENEVPEEVWEDLKKNSLGCRSLLAQGKLKPVTFAPPKRASRPDNVEHVSDGVPREDKFPKPKGGKLPQVKVDEPEYEAPREVSSMKDVDIGKMTSLDAVAFIEKVYTEDNLKRFKKQEDKRKGAPRKKVLDAIDKQMQVMRADQTQTGQMSLEEEDED